MPYGHVADADLDLYSRYIFNMHCESYVFVQEERVFVIDKCRFEGDMPVQGAVELSDNKRSSAGDADVTTACDYLKVQWPHSFLPAALSKCAPLTHFTSTHCLLKRLRYIARRLIYPWYRSERRRVGPPFCYWASLMISVVILRNAGNVPGRSESVDVFILIGGRKKEWETPPNWNLHYPCFISQMFFCKSLFCCFVIFKAAPDIFSF